MPYPELTNPVTLTVLQRICAAIDTRIKAMKDEDNNQLWNRVFKGPLPTIPSLTYPCVGIIEGPEQKVAEMFPGVEKNVALYAEFKFTSRNDVDNYDTFRYYLGKLQQRLFGASDNLILGGLAINVYETGSNPEIESQNDPAPGGMLMFVVQYRHYLADPYHLFPAEVASYAYGQ